MAIFLHAGIRHPPHTRKGSLWQSTLDGCVFLVLFALFASFVLFVLLLRQVVKAHLRRVRQQRVTSPLVGEREQKTISSAVVVSGRLKIKKMNLRNALSLCWGPLCCS